MDVDLLDGLVRPDQVLEREDAVDGHAAHPVQGGVGVDAQSPALLHGHDALDGMYLKFIKENLIFLVVCKF